MGGINWWHTTAVGHFFNGLHLWSVDLFFFFMVMHLWGKFWMSAWRGPRMLTWVTGVVAFLVSIGTAYTGYVVHTNFDSRSGLLRRPRTGSTAPGRWPPRRAASGL